MTRSRLPIDPLVVSARRRGGGSGEPASDPVPPTSDALLLDSRQIAALLGIGRTKAFELMTRELPVIRLGRCVRVPRAQLGAWIESHVAFAERDLDYVRNRTSKRQ